MQKGYLSDFYPCVGWFRKLVIGRLRGIKSVLIYNITILHADKLTHLRVM